MKKGCVQKRKDSMNGLNEEAEIHRKALRRGKNLAFSEDTCLEKERLWLKVTLRKVGVVVMRRKELDGNRW